MKLGGVFDSLFNLLIALLNASTHVLNVILQYFHKIVELLFAHRSPKLFKYLNDVFFELFGNQFPVIERCDYWLSCFSVTTHAF